jgi:mannose-6-phosphate isomerase-like protein (cupin superfamily)
MGPDRFVIKGVPAERSELFTVIEYEGGAGVPGPPLHSHTSFEEAWYVLEGEVAFLAAGRTTLATRGTYLLVPRTVPHRFEVVGNRPARWLGIFSPGRYVGLVEELAEIMPEHGLPDLAEVDRVFTKYDTVVHPERESRPPAPE